MSTLRSFAGLFVSVSLFVLGTGCSTSVGGEDLGTSEQAVVAGPCSCPPSATASSDVVAPPCVCEPTDSIVGVEPGEPSEPSEPGEPSEPSEPSEPGPCPVGQHEECNLAPSQGNSIIAAPVCECVPDDDGCPNGALVTICDGVIQSAPSVRAGSSCIVECVPFM